MTRREHIKAQVNWKRSITYCKKFDHEVTLPWWIAAPAYPIIIGLRTLVFAGAVPWHAIRSATEWHSTPEPARPPHTERFVLVLRTFGHDGKLLSDSRQLRPSQLLPRVQTLESIVAAAAGNVGISTVLGFHDSATENLPNGVHYFSNANETWESEFHSLITTADAVVLFATPQVEMGQSFRKELDTIRMLGLQSRVLVVSPPDLDEKFRHGTNQILTLLEWPTLHNMPLVCYLNAEGRLAVHPSIGTHDDSQSRRYENAITTALSVITKGHEPDP